MKSNNENLKAIGHYLRETRQEQGLDLYDVADRLRIRPGYLFALEEGDLSAIPGKTYALGFMRSYAECLGFDGDEVVAEVKRQSANIPKEPEIVLHREPVAERRWPSGFAVAASLLVLAFVYGGWTLFSAGQETKIANVGAWPGEIATYLSGLVETVEPDELVEEDRDSASSEVALRPAETASESVRIGEDAVAAPLLPELLETPVLSGKPVAFALLLPPESEDDALGLPIVDAASANGEVAAVEPAAFGATDGSSRISLIANERSWVRVQSDDRSYSWTRTLEIGERFFMPDRRDLSLWTGNAGGLDVVIDGRAIGPLGNRGAVVRDVILLPEELLAAAQ